MAHYKGAASEGTRAANLLKKREKRKEEFERMKQKISEEHGGKLKTVESKFSTSFDVVEEELRSTTVGLVTLEEMRERRENLVREREKQIAAKLPTDEAEREKRRGKRGKRSGGTLSFAMEDEEEEEDGRESDKEASPPPVKKKRIGKFGKNPTVDTSFLPDRDREETEREEREKLRQEWVEQQEKIKSEEIDITYSYWDGSGHRRHVKFRAEIKFIPSCIRLKHCISEVPVRMKKGNTIYQFLQRCLENLRKDFSELRVSNVDSLMYIKEDLIIPQHYTFYDFIINKARGKSGPLFSFDVHEDVRLLADATVEKDEAHAGKVVLRTWYERNKHIFPASRWEPYDPEKHWEKYTISDNKKN